MEKPLHPSLMQTTCLVRSAKAGDRQALEDLFARYLPRVRQIVALRLGERQRRFIEAEDIVQEAFLKALQGLERFEHRSEGSFRNWLARCVECEIVDSVRRLKARKRGGGKVRLFGDFCTESLFSSVFAGREPTPSKVAEAREAEERIEEAILELPEHYREVIILRQLCEMSYAEVASLMGFVQEETARKACSRAIQKLKRALAG